MNKAAAHSTMTLIWNRLVIAIKKGSGLRALIDETLAVRGKKLRPAYEVCRS